MLIVTDSRTGRACEITGARRGLLNVRVFLDCPGGRANVADLRALVVADVLRRVVEAQGPQATGSVDHPELTREQSAVLARAAAALGVPRPEPHSAGPDDRADVWILAAGPSGRAAGAADPRGTSIAVAGVSGWDAAAGLPGTADGVDAQALRLGLLRHAHDRTADVTPGALAGAAGVLADWRRGMAEWSRLPSKALPGEIAAAARAALARDLATPKVLDLLDHVARAPGIDPGSKFELFASLDRFLALELARDIGRDPVH
jgi:hypothetical protein